MKNTTYSIIWYDKETNESTCIDLVDSTYMDWDNETIIERSFETIIENAKYDTNDGEYFEIYDANDEDSYRLYNSLNDN